MIMPKGIYAFYVLKYITKTYIKSILATRVI